MKTHYEVLGVGQGASPEEIRSAYKARIREVHPDVFQGAGEEATERAIELNGAYAVLSDPEKRSLYDRMLRPVPPMSPRPSGMQGMPVNPPQPDAVRRHWDGPGMNQQKSWADYAEEWNSRSEWDEEAASAGAKFLYVAGLVVFPVSMLGLLVMHTAGRDLISTYSAAFALEISLYVHPVLGIVSLKWLSEGTNKTKNAAAAAYLIVSAVLIGCALCQM